MVDLIYIRAFIDLSPQTKSKRNDNKMATITGPVMLSMVRAVLNPLQVSFVSLLAHNMLFINF